MKHNIREIIDVVEKVDSAVNKLESIYPNLKPSGLCSRHKNGGPLSCNLCYPNYRELCDAHAKVNSQIVAGRNALRVEIQQLKQDLVEANKIINVQHNLMVNAEQRGREKAKHECPSSSL